MAALQASLSALIEATEAGHLEQAQQQLATIARQHPLHPALCLARHNLAVAYYAQDNFEAAEDLHRQNLRDFPDHLAGHRDLAQTLLAKGEAAAGYALLKTSLQSWPDDRETRFMLALAALRLEDWATGWPAYEARWEPGELAQRLPSGGQLWQIDDHPQYLQILPEQGLGDQLMFARYLTLLEGMAEHIHYAVPPALRTVFAHSFPHIDCHRDAPKSPDTRYASIASLPWLLQETCPQPPAQRPYLQADWATLQPELQSLLPLLPQPFLAIAWRGNQTASHLASRSLQLADIVPVIPEPFMAQVDGPHVVSIQKDPTHEEQTLLAQLGIPDLSPALTDLNATAAILEASDALLSVDTAVAHLAGALDKPIILLQRPEGDWRWGTDHQGRAWYREVHPVIIQRN